MAFVLPNSVFLHTPKTAGTWIAFVLKESGMPVTPLAAHMHSKNLPKEHAQKFRFAFVRHPLTWYQSYFTHKMMNGWSNDNIDRNCRSADFRQFVDNVIDEYPDGYCSTVLYERHLQGAGFVGLFERLKPDLIRALEMAGERFDSSILDSIPPRNVSRSELVDIHYTTKLRGRVLQAEAGIIKRYYQ